MNWRKFFRMKVKKDRLTLTPEAENAMRVYFTDLYNRRERNFANAREVNNYFDRVKKEPEFPSSSRNGAS